MTAALDTHGSLLVDNTTFNWKKTYGIRKLVYYNSPPPPHTQDSCPRHPWNIIGGQYHIQLEKNMIEIRKFL
jgi:hypothetical protein